MPRSRHTTWKSPVRIACAYLAFGVLWILLSDSLVETPARTIQSVKGILFVTLSAALIYWLVRREMKVVRHTTALLEAVTEGTTDAVFVKDREGRYLLVNPASAAFMESEPGDILGKCDADFFDAASAKVIRDHDLRVMESERVLTELETLTFNRTTRTFLATKAPYFDAHRRVIGIIGVSRDITELARTQEALRASEERFRSIVQTTTEWIWTTDIHGKHTYSNPAVTAMLGYLPEEVVGMDSLSIMHPDDQAEVARWLPRCIADKCGWSGVALRWRHKDGGYRWVESNASPMLSPQGEVIGFFGADRDISIRRSLEEQLHQAQKMEAIGQLAGGVAHDFNNLLTVISGYCEVLGSMLGEQHASRPILEGIIDAGSRAAALTRQLLAFSRRQVMEIRIADLNQIVTDILPLLGRMMGGGHEVATELASPLAAVRVDAGQMGQVLMNLAANARDAMPTGGRLRIVTRGETITPDDAARRPGLAAGPYVVLEVTDAGCGIEPVVLSRVFEPFYTSKALGKGTGLGLAVVHGIVKQSGGHIEVESEVGKGSTFRIHLPAVNAAAQVAPKMEVAPDGPVGSETILLVEDDDAVRDFAAIVLGSHGYKVLKASGANMIGSLLAQQHEPIALLVTDVIMPHANGREVAAMVRQRHPGLPTLFISGFTDDVVADGTLAAGEAFLQKPFTSASLARKVREMLDGR